MNRTLGKIIRNPHIIKAAASTSAEAKLVAPKSEEKRPKAPVDFRGIYPDFLPHPVFAWRNPVAEKLERMDMLKRRTQIDIPEFYVGSILAVSVSDDYSQNGITRFLGICIDRDRTGLRHCFTLRNTIDGMGVEVMYEMYNPLMLKIEVIKLEKRLDDNLRYLRDAEPEYSTFPMDMQMVPHGAGLEVPINPLKVKLRPPPWVSNWEMKDLKGVEPYWELTNKFRKDRYRRTPQIVRELDHRFDIVSDYRQTIPREDEEQIYKEMLEFEEKSKEVGGKRRKAMFVKRQK